LLEFLQIVRLETRETEAETERIRTQRERIEEEEEVGFVVAEEKRETQASGGSFVGGAASDQASK
jgi:hypothetical protein